MATLKDTGGGCSGCAAISGTSRASATTDDVDSERTSAVPSVLTLPWQASVDLIVLTAAIYALLHWSRMHAHCV